MPHKPKPKIMSGITSSKQLLDSHRVQKTKVRRLSVTEQQQKAYHVYIEGATKRQLEWDLTFDDFLVLWSKSCHYCGTHVRTIGIDRIDNKQGYIKGNLVSCCTTCNFLKGSFEVHTFISKCLEIAKNMRGINATQKKPIQINREVK